MKSLGIIAILLPLMTTAFPRPGPMPRPLPSPQDSEFDVEIVSSVNTNTGQCDEGQFQDMIERIDQCNIKAEQPLEESILGNGDNLELAICQTIEARLRCHDDLASQCLDANRANNVRISIVEKQFQFVYNNTFLGQDFTDSCPALKEEETKHVKYFTGMRDRCSYTEMEDAFRGNSACIDEARARLDRGLDIVNSPFISDRIATFTHINCAFHDTLTRECPAYFEKCFSIEKQAEATETTASAMKGNEEILAGSIEGFTYKKNCQQLTF